MSANAVRVEANASGRDGAVDAVLLIMVVVWAGNLVVLKNLLGVVPPPAVSTLRFVLIAAVAYAVLAVQGGPWRIERADVARLVASALTGIALYQALLMEGIHRSEAFVANLLQGTEPLFALMLVRLAGTEAVSRKQWVGVAVSFLGTGIFLAEGTPAGSLLVVRPGDVLNLASAVVFALYGLLVKPLFVRYPGRTVMAHLMGVGTLALLAYAAPTIAAMDFALLTPPVAAAMAVSGLCAAYAGFWVWGWAIARRGLAYASPFIYLEVILAGAFAYAFLGERFGPLKIAGAAVILAGLHLARQVEVERG
jgi:drug/metabolite transporter (DMT)-like permease